MATTFLHQGKYKITFEDGSNIIVESENSFFAEIGQTTLGTTNFAMISNSPIIKVERL